ncbi:MAG: type II toxin-antitoxin system mRNA interferase toxin, RelE/StbE family [Calditrichae bacterium]|nr:type II toxin-antitoxin system mRNA interferase toxin, RelE/StbE family [Calditrichia bacterium]
MRKQRVTDTFKKDLKRMRRRACDEDSLWKVVKLIQKGRNLPRKCKDHPLKNKYKGRRGCHIDDDWILIYKNEKTCLILERTGSHSDLFESQ